MSPHKRRLAAIGLGLLAALALTGWYFRPAPPRYSVTDLGVLPGATLSSASGLNNRGDVVGLSGAERHDLRHAFLYRDGAMTDLGRFVLMSSHDGPAINDSGQITGVVTIIGAGGREFHASLYGGGQRHDLGTLPSCVLSIGEGLNSRGQVVGSAMERGVGSATGRGVAEHAFLASGGRMVDIGTLPGCENTFANGINTRGQIVGYCERQTPFGLQAFIYDSRTRKMTALATPPGFTDSYAQGINDRGQIVGLTAQANHKERAVLWADGQAVVLGAPPGLDSAGGAAINNHGEAVGTAWSKPGGLSQFISDHPLRLKPLLSLFPQHGTERAFVYRAGRMADLNGLISTRSGWVLQKAQGINDRGQIVGEGLHDGKTRAFLLTPR